MPCLVSRLVPCPSVPMTRCADASAQRARDRSGVTTRTTRVRDRTRVSRRRQRPRDARGRISLRSTGRSFDFAFRRKSRAVAEETRRRIDSGNASRAIARSRSGAATHKTVVFNDRDEYSDAPSAPVESARSRRRPAGSYRRRPRTSSTSGASRRARRENAGVVTRAKKAELSDGKRRAQCEKKNGDGTRVGVDVDV